MSKPGQNVSPTCTANSSRAAATYAGDCHSTTRISTILPPNFPGAHAAVGFARISAGSAKYTFELDRIFRALDECTVFMAAGTSGVVEPAASFVAHVSGKARTIHVGAEEPANASAFTECRLGKAGEVLPDLLGQRCAS